MAKSRVKVHGWDKTRNRALLGHPRRCGVRWCGVGCWSAGWYRLGRLAVLGESGCVDAPPHLQKKNRGSIQLPWCPPFLSLHPTRPKVILT